MDTHHFVMLVVGVVLLFLGAAARRRASAPYWGGTDGQERFVLVGLPSLGAVLLLAGFMPVLPGLASQAAALVSVILCVAAVGWGLFGLPLPRWVVPAHLRARREARRASERRARSSKESRG